MSKTPFLSVISPVYQAEKMVSQLVYRLKAALPTISDDYEIILVEDGSRDCSWEAIVKESRLDGRIKGIKLSRNFGQHYAITAGLDACRGEWVVVMDCDLQDQPEEIPKLFSKAQEGYQVVQARRQNRQDQFLKKLFSLFFYKILSYLTGIKQDGTIANFGLYHYQVIRAISSLRESVRYFPSMVQWVGFKATTVAVAHAGRLHGPSNYNFKRLFNLALDISLAYSDKPIRLTIKAGLFISFFSLVFALFTVVRYFLGYISVMGYTSLIVSIWFLSGLIISILGVIGLYVGKTFEGVKARPIYIIAEKTDEPA
ncbi:glycosyl transferase [Adhaeribacter aerolatus]|uniref:Glycosyl transferase n=1 Tax=Adhaeribacter aerolatus TaxID=670289 RepID=A0A512AU04_9BACT|nr:glycosyltransferase family 2 protein [Adhaeribacter aerolatus]GEO03201.1 glycosyl transferase [Adhaeribacter aerolatus]